MMSQWILKYTRCFCNARVIMSIVPVFQNRTRMKAVPNAWFSVVNVQKCLLSTAQPNTASDTGLVLLRQIISDLKETGNDVILPSDIGTQEEVARPFTTLIEAGVESKFLVDICIQKPRFFCLLGRRGKIVMELLNLLVHRCFSNYEDAIKIFAQFPEEICEVGVSGVVQRIDFLNNYGMESTVLRHAISSCPLLLFSRTADEMKNVLQVISSFFSNSQVKNLLEKAAHILLQNVDKLEEKYEYIYYGMGFEGQDFHGCVSWIDLSLEDIMTRHEFLKKAGKYVFPDQKRPQLAKENPSLRAILDTSDSVFAKKIAGVSVEEWNIYKLLAEKMREESGTSFQRIKPSLRKAYEKKLKRTQSFNSYTFDSTVATL